MSKTIGFISGDHGVGTTMISQSVAEIISKRGASVLLVMSSGDYGCDFFTNKDSRSIDNLKSGIITGSLSYEEVKQQLVEVDGIMILPTVSNEYTATYYPENTADILSKTCEGIFEYIIFDVGCNFNLGLTISAIICSEKKYIVVTQQEKTIRRYLSVAEKIFKTLDVKGELIINKYISNISLLSCSEMRKIMEVDKYMTVPYLEYGWQAEIEKKTLTSYPKFEKAIELIADDVTGEVPMRKWKKSLIWKHI